ncbi:hypothetical protein Snoj_39400 [Streptomyces nojiriensis]|uniref:Transposase n=1 Tax=Streptomyces nojiriensis TaxID=66374 RepID=A0ABQ3SPZ1_9ACTN|nr:hypothetical protein GCM10010205_08050 [Streptomyces nojiriensis]GHI70022.1 hypothetical protein Snoj_39400 [Streptomyces nojiriensis]
MLDGVRDERGPDKAPQGRKKLAREQAAYFPLMDQGYCNPVVGIDVRTGKKWRNGYRSRGQGRRPLPLARKATVVRHRGDDAHEAEKRCSGAPSAPQVGPDAALLAGHLA